MHRMSSAAFTCCAPWLVVAAVSLFAATHDVVAQPLLCAAIRRGETATDVARRITGDASNLWQPWFEIVDPSSSRVVPKTTYDYVRVGWNACVATGWTRNIAPVATRAPSGFDRLRDTYQHASLVLGAAGSNVALWVLLLAFIAVATHNAEHYFDRRKRNIQVMRQFGERFVDEFEQPLVTPGMSSRPVESRLRFAPHAARVDVLLAPGAGHVYPNLRDHKRNVEYDIERVLHLLRDQPFVNARPYMDGKWVVLPFQWTRAISQAGDR